MFHVFTTNWISYMVFCLERIFFFATNFKFRMYSTNQSIPFCVSLFAESNRCSWEARYKKRINFTKMTGNGIFRNSKCIYRIIKPHWNESQNAFAINRISVSFLGTNNAIKCTRIIYSERLCLEMQLLTCIYWCRPNKPNTTCVFTDLLSSL